MYRKIFFTLPGGFQLAPKFSLQKSRGVWYNEKTYEQEEST